MITTTETLPAFDTFCDTLGYDPASALFFDIETTGFSPSSSTLFLIGALYIDGKDWKLEQFFAENPAEESDILAVFLELAAHFDTLVHFNGSTFDLPYLTKKAQQYHMTHTLSQCASVDLYQKFRPIGKLFTMEHMNQTALEVFLGWVREDQLTGKHMVSLYKKYAACGEPMIRSLLLLHNHDDMIGMTKLLPMASYLALFDCNAAVLSVSENAYDDDFTAASYLRIDFTLKNPLPIPFSIGPQLHTEADDVSIDTNCTAADSNYISRNADTVFSCSLSANGSFATLHVPVFCGTLCHFFADYKNYYYLPFEDQAIHKSVASYVDKSCRMPAKASNCYIKKTSRFLPDPDGLFAPSFRFSFEDRTPYFEYSEAVLTNTQKLSAYLTSLLRLLFVSCS